MVAAGMDVHQTRPITLSTSLYTCLCSPYQGAVGSHWVVLLGGDYYHWPALRSTHRPGIIIVIIILTHHHMYVIIRVITMR